jgi:cell division protein ZapA (FtsZ GTPase activity inhibitor)
MNKTSLKISIAGRSYPVTVRAEEEENLNKAVKIIDEKIRDFEENYPVRDKQDLLAMCVLHFANEIVKNDKTQPLSGSGINEEELDSLISLIDNSLFQRLK